MEDQKKGGGFGDFLRFRLLVAPVIIQVLFWIGVAVCLVKGVWMVATPWGWHRLGGETSSSMAEALVRHNVRIWLGLAHIIVAPLILRVWAELLTAVFGIYGTVKDIKHNTEKAG